MNSSFGDNKKRLGSSASSVTEAKRRATVAQTWDFSSKQPRIPSASFSTTVQGMQSSTLAFQNARNSGVVPKIDLVVDVPTKSLTATVAATPFAPVRIVGTVAIADTPIFSISPALPLGLSFSTVDGSISGTPMETITTTVFTVTVSATSIYPTLYSTSTTFYLTIGDSTSNLLYQGYTNVPLSTGLPTIDSPSNTWGTRNDSIIPNILSGVANQIFNAENITSEQNIAGYFYGYFKAPETGSYTFGYNSDDGIELIVNGSKVINTPGSAGVQTGTSTPALSLVRNTYYPIRGLWSQGGGPGFLQFNALNIGGVNKISTYPIKSYFFN
jgi:hypothetical protein